MKTFIANAFGVLTLLALTFGVGGAPGTSPPAPPAIPSLWDTAWILPLADQETIDSYLTARSAQGFEVVLVGVTNWGMRNVPLGNGQKLFLGDRHCDSRGCFADLTKANNTAFDYLDALITKAGTLGLIIGLLPMSNGGSSDYVRVLEDATSNEHRAYGYGRYLGQRYKGYANLIWVLGGDVCPDPGDAVSYPTIVPLTRFLAHGILHGGARQPMTFHAGAIVSRRMSASSDSTRQMGP